MSRAWSWGISPAANAFDVASSAASRSAALTSWRADRLEDCNSSRTARSAAAALCCRAISATAWDFIAANFDSARPIKLIRAPQPLLRLADYIHRPDTNRRPATASGGVSGLGAFGLVRGKSHGCKHTDNQ